MKIKWKVAPAPTGPYRSFQHRDWPRAVLPDGTSVFRLECFESYSPWRVREREHPPITIFVRCGTHDGWKWVRLKVQADSLEEAKRRVAGFIERNPDHHYGL